MSIIQIVLLFSLLALGAWIFSKDFLPWIKGIGLILIALGGYFVMFPEHANVMAHYLNVGRGADLLLYFFIIASFFFRHFHLSEAEKPGKSHNHLIQGKS